MGLKPDEKRNISVNFIGYGRPESELWIMGFEESASGRWHGTTDEQYEKFRNGYTNEMSFEILKSTRGTYQGYSRLIEKLFANHKNSFFVCNLLPFGKRDAGSQLTIGDCIELGCSNHEKLYEITIEDRYNALLDFFKKWDWKDKYIIFCIGNTNCKDINLKKSYLRRFLEKLYALEFEKVFKPFEHSSNKTYTYLYHDNEKKKFITYQGSSGPHINRGINFINKLLNT